MLANLKTSTHKTQVLDLTVAALICLPSLVKYLLRLLEVYVA